MRRSARRALQSDMNSDHLPDLPAHDALSTPPGSPRLATATTPPQHAAHSSEHADMPQAASPSSPQPMSTGGGSVQSSPTTDQHPPSPAASASPTSPPCKVRLTMAYPHDPLAADKWKAAEGRAAEAEQEACRLRASDKKARKELAAVRKQHQAFVEQEARAIQKAVRAADGAMVLQLSKVKYALYDAKRAIQKAGSESTWRLNARTETAEREAELMRVRLELRDKDLKLAAQSTRLQQLEARAEHSKLSIASSAAAATAAEQGRVAAIKERAAAEKAATAAEAEAAEGERALEAERQDRLSVLSHVESQLKDSEAEVGRVTARLQQQVEQRLRLVALPESRNWKVSTATAANYRSMEVQALVELLESRHWRPEDIATALASACFKGTTEPISLQFFYQKEFWYLRTGWMRSVLLELETEGKWSAGGTVLLKVAGPFSEGQIDCIYHHLANNYHPDIDRHKRADLLANPFDTTDVVKVPRPVSSRWRWVPLFQAAKKALHVETDETGTVAVRPFLTLATDIFRADSASGSILPHVGRSPDHPLVLTLMLDGFPLDKQSIEHLCLANSSLHDGVALHSEAALRCGVIAGMKETNATFARLFETKGVGADLNAIASGSISLPCDCDSPGTVCQPCDCDSQKIFTRLAVGADRKAIEALRGSGPCSPWCETCGREVQHTAPLRMLLHL